MSILYKRVESLCSEKGITGYRLCKDVGISPNIITELRSGRRDGVNASTANKIANYFGVSVAYLLGSENEKPALMEESGLDRKKMKLIESIRDMTDEQVMALQAIVNQIKVR